MLPPSLVLRQALVWIVRDGSIVPQATIEKASIDEVYIDVTAMVDKELQVIQKDFVFTPS